MGKRTIKTYGKKKERKKNVRPIVINVTNNVYNLFHTTNLTHFNKSSSTDEFEKLFKQSTCESKSGDDFDKLLKEPTYNKSSTASTSPKERRFFQRQETQHFYHSDANLEKSSSVHLFKDTFKDSDSNYLYSTSHIPTPPSYRMEKKKFIKGVPPRKLKSTQASDLTRKRNKCKRLVNSPLRRKNIFAVSSSTPTRPHLVVPGGDWMGVNMSPILPPEMAVTPSQDIVSHHRFLAIEANKHIRIRMPLDMSALAEGLQRLGIATTSIQEETSSGGNEEEGEANGNPRESGGDDNPASCKRCHNPGMGGADGSSINNVGGTSFKNNKENVSQTENEKDSSSVESKRDCSSRASSSCRDESEKNTSPAEYHQDESQTENEKDSSSVESKRDCSSSCRDESEKNTSPAEDHQDDSPIMKESANNSPYILHRIKEVASASSANSEKGGSPLKCEKDDNSNKAKSDYSFIWNEKYDSPAKNENTVSPMKNKKDDSPVKSEDVDSPMKSEEVDNPMKNMRVDSSVKNQRNYSLVADERNCSPVKDESWMGKEMDDTRPRLSLRPGKQWKRSFLQYRIEENRRSLASSSVTSWRRSSITPALLAKLVNSAHQNTSAPDLSRELHESFNETLPILRLDAGALSTITKRRRRRSLQRLDIVQEEQHCEQTFSLHKSSCSDLRDESKQTSSNMFQDDEKFFNDSQFLCSGVNDLTSTYLDQPSCHVLQEEGALSVLTDNVEECPPEELKLGALARCGQTHPLPFAEVFPDTMLCDCKKIGEGVFGEVFMLRRSKHEMSVVKIIPVEGTQLVNNEPQKCLDEVLSEVLISEELSLLRNNLDNCTSGFCELKNKFCLLGAYPAKLVELWKTFAMEAVSENDCPDMFGCDQLYIALELDHAGQPVESFKFNTAEQALSVFLQTTFSLGIAELSIEFEHRDLHIGNVLIKDTTEQYVSFIHNSCSFQLPTYGVKATIIDFTLSRMSYEGDVLFCDLAKDPELFKAEGDYQFEIYRLMRDYVNNDWRAHAPITNIRWLDYLVDKLLTKKKYKKNKLIVHKQCMKKLRKLKEIVLDFRSSSDLSEYLLESYKETVELIRFC